MIARTAGERHLNLTHVRVPCRTCNCVNVSLYVIGCSSLKAALAKAYSFDPTAFYKFSPSSFHLLANNE